MKLSSNSSSEKRSPFDICADILRVLSEDLECSRSKLASKSNLDSRGISRYEQFVIRNQLAYVAVGNNGDVLRISDKGRKYLSHYVKLVTMLD
ncbi:MAG: winged helix-turn-helix domain-containing protein [Nitrososphaera sp.]|nr:winged helix-turn-helix domain-containing protein [Nitrososphaera sp.]